MLQNLSSTEVTELLAYHYTLTDEFKKELKNKNSAKLLRASLAHKVKKANA